MAKPPIPDIKVECTRCFGDGWFYHGLSSSNRFKQTCPACEGRGYIEMSPFMRDPKRHRIYDPTKN